MTTPKAVQIGAKLKQEAYRLGFQLVGITSPDPPEHLDIYQSWIDAGHHGEMEYLATPRAFERRSDPQAILAGCQSIIVLGTHYRPSHSPMESAQVACYALGDDYHTVLNERAAKLIEFLENETGRTIGHRVYTDTGPILERELAQRAGLGWIGKNTCLINSQQGSYFFITVILLQQELALDEPIVTDHCGSCRRCIDACPTACIREDRTLDASRCISYLTIELKGQMPDDLRGAVGNWVFGCDICQDVCPWNVRFAATTQDPAFQPRQFLKSPNLIAFLELDEATYQIQLGGSPLKRSKLEGLRRNAATAAGNQKLRTAVAALSVMLEQGSTVERVHAAWALGRIGGEIAASALKAVQQDEIEFEVQSEIERALKAV